MKKVIGFLLAMALTVCFSACRQDPPEPDPQSADTEEPYTASEENHVSEESLVEDDAPNGEPVERIKIRRSMLTDVEQQLYDRYLPDVLSFTPFTVRYEEMDYELESLQNALYAIRVDHPQTWMYFSDGSDYDTSVHDYVSYSAIYFFLKFTDESIATFDPQEMSDYIARIDDVCDAILQQMPEGLSTKEKYVWLADYLCLITYYDDEDEHNLYADGPLLYGKGICQSYSHAYQWLCQKAGLWSTTCSGLVNGIGHSWNVVRLDNGKTYYMDVTWVDTSRHPADYYFMTYKQCLQSRTIFEGEWIADGD